MQNFKKQIGKGLTTFLSAGLLFSISPSSAFFAEENTPDFSSYKKLENYEATGKKRSCVRLRSIQSTTILDNQTIFFRVNGKKAYVNKLPRRCAGMRKNDAFSYTVHTSQLCRVDIINVFDSGLNFPKGSCGLGNFYEFKKIKKEAKSEDKTTVD